MPYELAFSKAVAVADRSQYFNDCCYGGDVIIDLLAPTIGSHFDDVKMNQEDWGWFIWFRRGSVSLAVDVFCDDPVTGAFRLHLTSRIKRPLLPDRIADLPELEEVKTLVLPLLEKWLGTPCRIERLDKNYIPAGNAA